MAITYGREVHRLDAPTIAEGLAKITKQMIKGKGVLTLKMDGKTASILVYPMVARRLSVNSIARVIKEKQLINCLK